MKRILFLIIGLSIIVSCGENNKKNESQSKPAKSVKKTETPKKNVTTYKNGIANVLITTSDVMKFNIKEFTVNAGEKVKLTLQHIGKLDKKVMGHNVVILKRDVKLSQFASKAAAASDNDYIPKGTTDVLAYTKMIGGGETTTIEFTAPDEAGVYDFICSFPAHYAMMKGKFIVE